MPMENTMKEDLLVKKLFVLWETMADLENILWETYLEKFMQLCCEKAPDPSTDPYDDMPA
jgi:hypothetical protein